MADNQSMRILLINPPRFKGHSIIREMRCVGLTTVSVFPPIELAYLAGHLRKQAEVKIIDANALNKDFQYIEQEIRNFRPQAVVFTASLPSFSADAQVARIAKNIDNNIKTILLDSHVVPVMPEKIKQTFPEIDYLVGTEPLLIIPKILGFEGDSDLNKAPLPAYDLLPIKKYSSISFARKKPFAVLITSVGCPNRCNFCIIGGATVDRGYGKMWQFKSPEKILEEVKYLLGLGIKSIYFFDETFTASRGRVQDLCSLIKKEGLKFEWSCNGRVDTLDEQTVKIMKEAGCWNIMFGLECGSEDILANANKGTTALKAMDIVGYCRKNKVEVSASFIIGFPGDTLETIEKTLEMAKKINVHRTQFDILTPLPGTKFYDEARANGLLESDYSFSGYDAYCVDSAPVIRTHKLTSQELAKAYKHIYRKFYLRPSLWFRVLFSIRTFGQFIDIIKFVKYLR